MNIILYAVPGFFILIALELIAERVRGTNYYRLNDALASLSTGTLNQLVSVAQKLLPFTLYIIVFKEFSLWTLPDTPLVWVAAFILYDLSYYWNHRMGHEMNILWASHVVHHSSEEYNLTTALRQTGTGFLSFIFYLPLAILGFDPLMIITVGALNLVYQFWVHTQHVRKLGWLDRVFVTPSNHRAHHAQNDVYIDRNYGGVFILWDRLFGSFQEELDEDPPIFGIRGALSTWNPIWANLQIYKQLVQDAVHTESWWYRLTIWFRRTGWRPPDVVDAYPLDKTDLADFKKYHTEIPLSLKVYCALQYAATAFVTLSFATGFESMSFGDSLGVIIFVFLSSFSLGALMEHKHYAGVLEWLRLSILLSMCWLLEIDQSLSITLTMLCLIGIPFLFIGRRQVGHLMLLSAR